LGPELSSSLVAPVIVGGGFINPLAVSSNTADDPSSVQLTAQALGVPIVVGGVVVLEEQGMRLELAAWVRDRHHRASLRGELDDLDRLLRQAVEAVARWTGLPGVRPRPLDLSGSDQDVARSRALVAAGFAFEAVGSLEAMSQLDEVDQRFLLDLQAAVEGRTDGDAALAALVSLGSDEEGATLAAFQRWAQESSLPVAHVWHAALARSFGDDTAAGHAFQAAAIYPYGVAARAAHRAIMGAD